MINIAKYLKENNEVTRYTIREIHKVSKELFFVHKSLETVRGTDTKSAIVTVYNVHNDLNGSSTFTVYESDGEEELLSKIDEAITKAKSIDNKDFDLPIKDDKAENVCVKSNISSLGLNDVAEKISEAVFKADNVEGGSINALEIFVNKYNETITNSNNLEKSMEYYEAFIECIPTWNGEKESVELYHSFVVGELNSDEITKQISEKLKEVEYRYSAVKPENTISMPILLRSKELIEVLYTFLRDANARMIYSHSNLYKIGDNLQESSDCDKLNVSLKSVVEGLSSSRYFDEDGTTLIDTDVIEDGVLKNVFGDNRFSKYLGIKPTGLPPCVVVEKGSLDISKFNEPYFEVVSMSGIQLDAYSDYIGGEVRLGLIHENNKVYPITGISLSGSLSKSLNTIKLSTNIILEDNYKGPDSALIRDIEII